MPDEKKKKTTGIEPSQSLWEKLFGSAPMSDNVRQAIELAKKENPNLAPVEMYGPLSKLMMDKAVGYTSPGGSIYLNPNYSSMAPQEIADTLTHEQTHVNQLGGNPVTNFLRGAYESIATPYHKRPEEREAYQAEVNRALATGRTPTAIPSFLTGEFYVPQDIRLRDDRKTGIEAPEDLRARLMREPRVKRR